MWHCPLCKAPISLIASPIRCQNSHSFDKAKSGYVNLLPVQFKKSKAPGDDKEMVKARREFHQLNAYGPLKEKMVSLLQRSLKDLYAGQPTVNGQGEHGCINIFDAGCGEGSYLDAITQGLSEHGFDVQGAGSDIAKVAVELAAKAFKQAQFVVASSFELPLETGSQDVMLQVFAPGSDKEYFRVLKDNGLLITVDPAQKHLFELKQQVYANPRPHELNDSVKEGFSRIENETFSFPIAFESREHALALIKMTPFYWKLPKGKIDEIVEALKSVTADFHIQLWKKHSDVEA